MNYRIEKKGAFRIVGVKTSLKMDIEENFSQVPLFWQETVQKGLVPKICALMSGEEPAGLLGVSTCMRPENFEYYVAAASRKNVPEGMTEYLVPGRHNGLSLSASARCPAPFRRFRSASSPNGCPAQL
jgi:AraC family transcriptional regulator